MKRTISKILALVVVVTMLSGMISVASAQSLFEASQEYTNTAEPNVVTGSQYVMEAVININSLPTDGDPRGVKLVVGTTAGSNSNLNVWLVHNAIRVNDDAWSYFSEYAYDFLPLVGQDVALKLVVDNGYLALYVNGALALNLVDAKLPVTAESKFSIGNWDGPCTVKSLTLKTLDTQSGGETLYELTEEKQWSVDTNTQTGSKFVAEATLNITDFKAAESGRGLKFVIGNESKAAQVWIGKNNIWADADGWKNMINVDMSGCLNQDTKFKLLVDDSLYVLYVNDKPVWTLQDPSLQPVNGAKLSMDNWDLDYTIKSLTIKTLEPNVLFEQNTPAANGLTPGVTVGSRYEADMELNISAMSDTGIKMILGKNSNGNDVELWLAQNDIFVACPSWIGSGLSQTNFHFDNVKDRNIPVKVTVADTTITVMVDGEKAWEFTDDAFRLTEDSIYELGQWSATYTVNRFKLTKLEQTTSGGDEPGPLNPDPEDPNVLYQSDTPSSGAVAPGVTTGSQFVAEMVINASAFTNEYGNVKFLVGKNANGDDIQMEFNKQGFWAIVIPAEGDSTYIKQTFDGFAWGDRLNEDVSFKLVVDGATWTLYVDGAECWKQTDAVLEATAESKFATGAWEVTHSVKSIKLSKLPENEGGDPVGDEGIPGNTESEDPNTLYYWTGEYNGMNAAEGTESVNFKVAELCGTDYELEAKVNVASIGSGEGRGIKLILRGFAGTDSGDMELWIGTDHIWACTDGWKGHTAFDFTPYLNQKLTVKAVAKGDTVKLSLNGTEVWSCTDAGFAQGTETNIELGGWDAKYVINSVQVRKLEEETSGGDTDPNALYNWTGEYTGMNPAAGGEHINFVVDRLCGTKYNLEAVIHVASIKDGEGRGVKLILGGYPGADSGDMELWIGKDHIWACTDGWKGQTEFDFAPYMNKDVKVKVAVNGDTIVLYLDGTKVWSCTDASFAKLTEDKIELGGWDAYYLVKSVRVTTLDTSPVTGDSIHAALPLCLILAAGCGMALVRTRKKWKI